MITDEAVDEETMASIKACAVDGASLLKIDSAVLSSDEIVDAIDHGVVKLQKSGGLPVSEEEDPAVLLGSLWGYQLVQTFGWQWTIVTFREHNNTQAIGVLALDRSLAIYPFHFIMGCLENDAPVTIQLAFNILKDQTRIPPLPPNGYENVMEHAHHPEPDQ